MQLQHGVYHGIMARDLPAEWKGVGIVVSMAAWVLSYIPPIIDDDSFRQFEFSVAVEPEQ